MKIIILIAMSFTSIWMYGQTTYTYKPNPISGKLEVFKKSESTYLPEKVAIIERNPISGYLEIKEYSTSKQVQQSSSDPYTYRPNFELVKQIKAYDPYTAIIDQINTLNTRIEHNLIQRESSNNSNSALKSEYFAKQTRDYWQNMSTTADNLLNFYNAQAKFPTKLSDGYYLTTEIQDGVFIKANNALDLNNKIIGNKQLQVGIAKIQNNKLTEYFESCWSDDATSTQSNIFRKLNIPVSSNVENCKVMFREEMRNEYRSLYFFDNILDSTSKIPNPNFGYLTLFTDGLLSDSKKPIGFFMICMGRNTQINPSESFDDSILKLPYSSAISYNNNSNKYNCSNSNLTFAFNANAGKYSILIYNIEKRNGKNDRWYFEDIKFTEGTCGSSILKTN